MLILIVRKLKTQNKQKTPSHPKGAAGWRSVRNARPLTMSCRGCRYVSQRGVSATASVAQSWTRFQRSPFAFAVIRADQAVAVFVDLHSRDIFACPVFDPDSTAGMGRTQRHQLFAVGLVGRDRATPKRRGQADAQAA